MGKRAEVRHNGKRHVGNIVGWLSAEDNDGLALWHLKHDSSDSEDLEEYEVVAAVAAFDESNTAKQDGSNGEDDTEWQTDHEWIGKRGVVTHGDEDHMGTIVGWLPASVNDGLALWHLKHDSSDSEDLEESEAAAALKHRGKNGPPAPRSRPI